MNAHVPLPAMRLVIDHEPAAGTEWTLAAAVEHARQHAEAAGRVVVEVSIDGRSLTDDELSGVRDVLGDTLSITTANTSELVLSVLGDVRAVLDQAKSRQSELAVLVHQGRLEQAIAGLSEPLRAWESVRSAVAQGAALLGVNPDTSPAPLAGDIRSAAGELSACLVEVKRSLTARDWAGLADVLGEDLSLQASRWQDLLIKLENAAVPHQTG